MLPVSDDKVLPELLPTRGTPSSPLGWKPAGHQTPAVVPPTAAGRGRCPHRSWNPEPGVQVCVPLFSVTRGQLVPGAASVRGGDMARVVPESTRAAYEAGALTEPDKYPNPVLAFQATRAGAEDLAAVAWTGSEPRCSRPRSSSQ